MKNKYVFPTTPLLIIGCPRSGTTIVASVLGAHPDINMVLECPNEYAFRLLGKRYSGNKLCLYNQIRLKRRGSLFGRIVNTVVNYGRRPANWKYLKRNIFRSKHLIKIFPDSKCSIVDYVHNGAKFIVVVRNRDENINSLIKRGGKPPKIAKHIYNKANKEMQKILNYFIDNNIDYVVVKYENFIANPFDMIERICKYLLNVRYDRNLIMRMIENGSKYNLIYPDNKKLLECARVIYRGYEK